MRFYPFGSSSFGTESDTIVNDSYVALTSVTASFADYALKVVSASWVVSSSVAGPTGDAGSPSTYHGPYETYPVTC
jgi:hypothetical protein